MTLSSTTELQRNDIDVLYYFVIMSFLVKLCEDISHKISQLFMKYNELWALFKSEDLAASEILSIRCDDTKLNSSHYYDYSHECDCL